MSQSKELQAIVAAIPTDFADPAADFRAVRTMFAPFHGHATADDFHIAIESYGGVRCGKYNL
jgi:monoterpene epsilon-lactone hydrolase